MTREELNEIAPLPWKAVKGHYAWIEYANTYHMIRIGSDMSDKKAHDNAVAAEIVRRVNNYDGVLETLRLILMDLPARRDWLDPEVEVMAREFTRDAK